MAFDALTYSPMLAPLVAGQAISLPYPAGRSAGDYASAGHYALIYSGRYSLTPTFGVSTISFTWAHETVQVGSSIALQFELIAGPVSLEDAARRDLANVDVDDALQALGLSHVDDTADADKPVSSATQAALTAGLAGKQSVSTVLTFLATASAATAAAVKTLLALVKGDVGLGSVDNTSDANKPVSTATQTALNLKADSSTTTAALALKADITYVDALAQGLDPKASVRAATTANITLSGAQTIDGIACAAGDRVLVKNQSSSLQNGIYVVAAGAWARAADMDAWAEVPSAYLFVEQGTANAETGWLCTADTGGTLNTTAITWTGFGATPADGTITTAKLADDGVTNAKLANMAQATIKGRASGAGTGDPTDLSASQVKTILGYGTAADQNTGTSGANVPLLNGTNTWSGGQTFAGVNLTGVSATIAAGVIAKSGGHMIVDTEGAATTDDLATITGGVVGDLLLIRAANTTRDVVLVTGGNIIPPTPGVFTLSDTERAVLLFYTGSVWVALATTR